MEKKNQSIHLTLAVLATGVMSFAGVLIETAMNVTFPTLIKQFALTTSEVQWVTTIYLLMISIIVPLSTFLYRNFSIRKLFLFANVMFLLGVIVDTIAPTFSVLLLGRLLQGVATGVALPLMFQIILEFAPLSRRGAMMGLGTLTTSIAPAIGPTYGGILTAHLSWHYIYLFLIPVLLVALGLGLYAIPETKVVKGGRLDLLSVAGLVLLFSGSLLFLSLLGEALGLVALAVGVGGFYLFYRRSMTQAQPLIRLSILKNKTFRLFLLSFLVYQFLLLGVSFVLPNFIQIVKGQDAFVAGLAMLPGAAVGAILSPISGKILDQVGPKKPITIGLLLAALGWLTLTLTLGKQPLLGLVACHVFYMIGLGLSYSNMMTTGMNSLEQKLQGDGNALFNTLQQFSGAVATSLVAVVINLVQVNSGKSYAVATTLGSQLALGILFILLLLSLLGCYRYFRKS